MNTKTIKEVGMWMMVIGGCIFTGGAGITFVCNRIENNALKNEKKAIELEKNIAHLDKKHELEEQALIAKADKDAAYADKLKNMSDKEFAKFHAERTATVNKETLEEARRIKREAEAEVTKTKIMCEEKIDDIRKECLSKIEKANDDRDEAIEKYEKIDALFTNKKEILKAKKSLEALVQKKSEDESELEDLLDSIRELLD